MNDLSFFAIIFILLFTSGAAIGYLIGTLHGHQTGELHGANLAKREYLPRVMKAKRDGFHSGRIKGLHEALGISEPFFWQNQNRPAQISTK